MRYVYIALIVILASVVGLFKFQNLEAATVTLWSMSITLPMSILVLLIYLLGMFTGGFMLALVRGWIQGAKVSSR